MSDYIYARVSTKDQNLEGQVIEQGNTKEAAARAVKVGVATLYRYIKLN